MNGSVQESSENPAGRAWLTLFAAATIVKCWSIGLADENPVDSPPRPSDAVTQADEDLPELPDDSDLLDREYAGRALRDWRIVLKNLDHTAPSAVAEIPGLIAIMQDAELPWFTRRQAALTLGRIGEPAAQVVPLLVEHLASSEEDTVLWAAKSIALFGPIGGPAASSLAEILGDESRSHITRMMALEALARIGPGEEDVLPAIIAILLSEADSGEGLDRRVAACDALALLRSGAAPALPYLIRLLHDGSSRVRTSAATAIGAIGESASSAIEPLVDVVLFDEAPEARDAAATGLGNIGVAAEPALLTLAHDSDAEVRRLASVALVRVTGSADAVAALQTLATEDESELVRITAIESLRMLMAEPAITINAAFIVLQSDDRQVRIRAYRVLLECREHEDLILPRMMDLLGDERRHVRDTARRFLEGWENAGDSP